MSGDKTAIDAAMALTAEPDEPEQLEIEDMLGLPARRPGHGDGPVSGEERGPGRPRGSRNKRTTAMVDFLMRQYKDPRAVLLQIAQADVEDLVARLGCTAMEALQEKRLAAIGVLPYIAQKQPLAINLNAKGVVYLTIEEGTVAPTNGSAASLLTLDLTAVERIEQNQGDSEGDDDKV